MTVKTLVCGSVLGRWDQWQARVQSVHQSHGPFELVLCMGNLFAGPTDAENSDVMPYLRGEKRVAIETLFVHAGPGPMPPAVIEAIDANDGYVCDNVIFLGQSGVLTTASGLKIAYLSGSSLAKDDDETATDKHMLGTTFSRRDVQVLKHMVQSTGFEGVDFFLSGEWPRGIAGVPSINGIVLNPPPLGSETIAELAKELRPRYQFVASDGNVYYERPPYKNVPIVPGRQVHVSRFFAMASCGNPKKAKWIMALNMVPMTQLDSVELAQEPQGTTPSPYTRPPLSSQDQRGFKRNQPIDHGDDISSFEPGTFFYGNAAHFANQNRGQGSKRGRGDTAGRGSNPPPDYVCRICNIPGHFIRDCPSKPTHPSGQQSSMLVPRKTGCWFCLANPEVEKHLIVSIGRDNYMALAKGGLTPDHVLIIPTGHFPSSPEVPPDVHKELERYKQALRDAARTVDKVMVFYEVNVKSQHMHVQAIPVPAGWTKDLLSVYRQQGGDSGLVFTDESEGDLSQQFFRLEVPTDASGQSHVLFHQVSPNARFPFSFGRQVIANLSGQPSRSEWKACVKNQDAEKADVAAFKAFFKPFDFSLAMSEDD